MTTTPAPLPLDHIRVLDFTQVMLGPCATQTLADLGADVIKIERPGAGDLSRNFFGVNSEAAQNNAVFASLNRNKRSMTVDTKSPEGRQIILDLVQHCDVVVDNFRAGVMTRLGLDYESLRKINPRIICASGTGYGPVGPHAAKGGQDVLAQAMTGTMEKRSDASIPMSVYPTTICDYAAGQHLIQAIMAALFQREKTGRGQQVHVSLYDSMLACQMQEIAQWTAHGEVLNWADMPLTGVFKTLDGALVLVGAFKANPLQDICRALGIEDLSPLYPDVPSQRPVKPLLQARFAEVFASNTTAHWLARLGKEDLLSAEVRSLGAALADEQTTINGMLVDYDHPYLGPIQLAGLPLHLADAPLTIRRGPPRLGEHTDEILREFGLTRMPEAAQ